MSYNPEGGVAMLLAVLLAAGALAAVGPCRALGALPTPHTRRCRGRGSSADRSGTVRSGKSPPRQAQRRARAHDTRARDICRRTGMEE